MCGFVVLCTLDYRQPYSGTRVPKDIAMVNAIAHGAICFTCSSYLGRVFDNPKRTDGNTNMHLLLLQLVHQITSATKPKLGAQIFTSLITLASSVADNDRVTAKKD